MLEKTTPVSVVLVARLGEARAPLPSSATHILLFSGEQGQLLSTPHSQGNLSCYRPFVLQQQRLLKGRGTEHSQLLAQVWSWGRI